MTSTQLKPGTPIKIAVLAIGGQGGGVLADWLVDMAEQADWWAQTTSVPGVAQRTGATIYYLEMLPMADVKAAGRRPALAVMPTPGDVDVIICSELMEAGRAIMRGLVTPDRSTMISSSHRDYAIGEKSVPSNGMEDPNAVIEASKRAAKRFICLDLLKLANQGGSVISSSLFGAVAGSGVLPFTREQFEETIRRGGLGVESSLKAFALAFDAAANAPESPANIVADDYLPAIPETAQHPRIRKMLEDLKQNFPIESQPMMVAGLRRTIDYQDIAYGAQYMEYMHRLHKLDLQHGGPEKNWALTTAAARYVAVAMAYDDVIRVADLKTRGTRFQRIEDEMNTKESEIMYMTEYMHPRVEELCGTMPAPLGRFVENSKLLSGFLGVFCKKGRYMQTATISGFLLLYVMAGMRRFRRSTLRHKIEVKSTEHWLRVIEETAGVDYELAVEIINCRRLVKGYSDTHGRGESKYRKLIEAADQMRGQPDAAKRLKRLRESALTDVRGLKLDTMLAEDKKAVTA